jgi:hypothetical protein
MRYKNNLSRQQFHYNNFCSVTDDNHITFYEKRKRSRSSKHCIYNTTSGMMRSRGSVVV